MKNNLVEGKKYFSIDAETDGLWGNPFAVAGIVYEVKNNKLVEIDKICLRLPNEAVKNEWVIENVLPTLNFKVTHDINRFFLTQFNSESLFSQIKRLFTKEEPFDIKKDLISKAYKSMLKEFAEFYLSHKDSTVVWHIGHIVESHLFREMHRLGFIGEWEAPYTPVEISSLLLEANEPADSVDSYAKKHNLKISEYGSTHNPLYDCEVTAKVFEHLSKQD